MFFPALRKYPYPDLTVLFRALFHFAKAMNFKPLTRLNRYGMAVLSQTVAFAKVAKLVCGLH
jgi:hypothetical protein